MKQKENIFKISILSLAFLPFISFAKTFSGVVESIIGQLNIVPSFLIAVAASYFLYGLMEFVRAKDIKKVEEAKKFIVYGLIALVIMISVWGLVGMIVGSLNLDSSSKIEIPQF